jgi:putative FmdB family regulatory protein
MPTYEYLCSQCGHEFEKFQSMTAQPTRKCPKCGKNTVKRLIGRGSGVIFKGSGFYETDYRSENYKKSANAEKETNSPAKESTGSDKKKNTSADDSNGDTKKT